MPANTPPLCYLSYYGWSTLELFGSLRASHRHLDMVLAGMNPVTVTGYLNIACEDTNQNAGVNKYLLHAGQMLPVLFYPTEISSLQKFVIWYEVTSLLDRLHQTMFHLNSSINMMHETIQCLDRTFCLTV